MNMTRFLGVTILLASSFMACAADQPANVFITLGTAGGPEGEANRSQPANALLVGKDLYLVDAGDGAAGQLKKAGFRLPQVRGIFLSHNHFDHTGGMLAILGLRMQLNAYEPLTVYGPPGTKTFIEGLLTGMEPARDAAYGMPGRSWTANIEVIELVDGAIIELDGLEVTVAENTHFRRFRKIVVRRKKRSPCHSASTWTIAPLFTQGIPGPARQSKSWPVMQISSSAK